MSKYAVVKINGVQYKVSEGDEILVDKSHDKNVPCEVLLVVDKDKFMLGKPFVAGAKVAFKILASEEKGKKIKILKYKAKSRYRKRLGFRPKYTRLLVEKIS
jgi:large subunit ribosomal protein L21